MGVKYVFGRVGKGKTHFILDEIKARLLETGDKKLMMIVPEQFTLQAERDLIEKLQIPGIIEVEVLSFTRLAHKVFSEVGGLTRVHINDQGKSMVLRKVMEEGDKHLTIYKKASQQEGFISRFNDLLCEMKQHDISPADLLMRIETLEEDSILCHKLQDIAYIYEKFNYHLQGNYMDAEDYLNFLIEKMGEAEFLKDAEIWMDGFHSFTPQTYRIIEKLIQMSRHFTIGLTMEYLKKEKDGDLFKISQLSYKKLHEIVLRLGVEQEIIDLDKEKQDYLKKSQEIQHLESELYAYPYEMNSSQTMNLEVFAGVNLYTEIENTAAQILSLIRDRGYRWKDIAVVCGDMEHYGTLIKRVFHEYEIPCFLDEKRRVMNNPIIDLILCSLEVVAKGYRYEDIFRCLKTGFLGLSIDACEELENYALAYGIQGNRWKMDFEKGEVSLLERLNLNRKEMLEPLEILEKKIRGKRKVHEITKALYEYLGDLKVHEKLEVWIEQLREKGHYEYVHENAQIWNVVIETFDQLVEILGEQELGLKEYIRLLDSGFSSLEIGIIPTTIDQVLVGNIQRSRSHEIKALFVVGVNDGILPAGKIEEGILSDEEKILLKDKGITLASDSERRVYEEKFQIYTSFAKPSEYLWISYALADQEGKALRPSILVDRLKKLFKEIKIKSDVQKDVERQLHLISTQKSTFKYLVENLRMRADGKPIEPLWGDVYHWYYSQKEWDTRREMMINGFFHKNQEGHLGNQRAKSLYELPVRSSVSRLEQFVNCPFAHFVKYGLRPKERQAFKVEAPDIGELFHRSMEEFTKTLRRENLDWREMEREQCDQIVDQVIEEMVPTYGHGVLNSSNRYKYLVKRLKRISKRAVWTLTDHLKKSGFEPAAYEVSFGHQGVYPAMEIELANGEIVYLEGRIDRVDLMETEEGNFVKIIDFKSGNKNFNLSQVYHGLELQLMIYLDAVLSNHGKLHQKEMKPAGVFYFKIDDPLIKTEEKVMETIEKEIRKKLKLKGLALKDVRIVREMDRELEGHSEILPVALNKNDEFYKSSSAIGYEEFVALLGHVRKVVRGITHEMMEGNIRIEPVKNGNRVTCEFCNYTGICQFDSQFEDNDYRTIPKLGDEEVLGKIVEGKEVKSDGDVD